MPILEINFIKGKNCAGKTTLIREMLGYELEMRYKYSAELPKRYSTENKEFLVVTADWEGLIVRLFLSRACKTCKEIADLQKKIAEQREKLRERDATIAEGVRYEGIARELEEKAKNRSEIISGYLEHMEEIKENADIDFDDISEYDYEELEQQGWYEYRELEKQAGREREEIDELLASAAELREEARGLKGTRGYKQLKDSLGYNEWRFYKDLAEHSVSHGIDIWITVLNKESLITLFQKIEYMKINRLFVDKLTDFWLVAELEEKFEHYISFSPPIKACLKFPQNVGEIYIETNSLDEEVKVDRVTIRV